MGIALTLQEYMDWEDLDYELIRHPYTNSSLYSAQVAHVPGHQLAKSVVLGDENGYLLAVIPATNHIKFKLIQQQLNRNFSLASEDELVYMFDDCVEGAIPPLGDAYGYEVIVDSSLTKLSDIYFEAGSHTDLVHLSGNDFRSLMSNAVQGVFSKPI